MKKIFVSHVREESAAAIALKQQLEAAVPGVTVWVSSVDLSLGQAWLQALEKELKGAKALLVLCGGQSATKPWINFESGFGHGKRIPVVPICHRGLRKEHLPYPLSMFQACEAGDPDDCARLVGHLSTLLGVGIAPGFVPRTMSMALTPRQTRKSDIGVLLAHRQAEWAMIGPSLFKAPDALPPAWRNRWTLQRLISEDKVASADLGALAGMLVGSPWRSAMSAECITELVDWVRAGGRMLMLGFELGDRHHGANLGELARRFGIHPMIDIVGPRDYGTGKPYNVWIDFETDAGHPHPLTHGLERIRLRNVQTVMVEPGGHEWLRVGEHGVFRPAGAHVYYREGQLTQPGGAQFEVNRDASWIPVGVDAPIGLTHEGAVRFLGTWDLLRAPAGPPEHGTSAFLERLLNWLAGEGMPSAP